MKRLLLIVGFAGLAGFAKANENVEILKISPKPNTSLSGNIGAEKKVWLPITITNSVKMGCSDGSYVITGYVYTTVDSETGQILGVSYVNTGNTCPPTNPS